VRFRLCSMSAYDGALTCCLCCASCSETLALSVIAEKALPPLVAALAEETEDHLKSATAWVLGQIGRHTSDHAKVCSTCHQLLPLACAWMVPNALHQLVPGRARERGWWQWDLVQLALTYGLSPSGDLPDKQFRTTHTPGCAQLNSTDALQLSCCYWVSDQRPLH